jgi:Arc/MetJ-type ribon-helix-helix transcriptional regulator
VKQVALVIRDVIHYDRREGRAVASPTTLRLDEETRRQIARIARDRRVSVSHVIRDALQALVSQEEAARPAFDAIADLIGIVHGGDPARSADTGRRLRALLRSRQGRP